MLSLVIILLAAIAMFANGGPKKTTPYNDGYFFLPDQRYEYEEYPPRHYYRNKRMKRKDYERYHQPESNGTGCFMIVLLIVGILLAVVMRG
ncbi:MAG: hypothetical protein RIR11_5024 [Bacteroidota bacterium]|jgi:hypothetical protein